MVDMVGRNWTGKGKGSVAFGGMVVEGEVEEGEVDGTVDSKEVCVVTSVWRKW